MQGVDQTFWRQDDTLLKLLGHWCLVVVNWADEIETRQILLCLVANSTLQHSKLADIQLSQLWDKVNICTAAYRMSHQVPAMEPGSIRKWMPCHPCSIATVFRKNRHAEGNNRTHAINIEEIGEGGSRFGQVHFDYL